MLRLFKVTPKALYGSMAYAKNAKLERELSAFRFALLYVEPVFHTLVNSITAYA